jgi:LacI family transcriptional regulator
LLKNNHRNIAFFNAHETLFFTGLRKKGVWKAMSDHGFKLDPHRYIVTEISEPAAKLAAAELLTRDNAITAFLCCTDTQAIGVMAACKEAGLRVGRDISVIGCDNNPQGPFCDPPLTSLQHGSVMDIGKKLADMLLLRITGTPVTELQVLMQPEWVERESDCVCL